MLLKPIRDVVPVHVCWNNQHGNLDRLVAVEFTNDCEVCSVQTDVLAGDEVEIVNNQFSIDGEYLFSFKHLTKHVGNIMWDMVWMPLEDAGRLAMYLQEKEWWSLECADTRIYKRWGQMTGDEFVRLLKEISEEVEA